MIISVVSLAAFLICAFVAALLLAGLSIVAVGISRRKRASLTALAIDIASVELCERRGVPLGSVETAQPHHHDNPFAASGTRSDALAYANPIRTHPKGSFAPRTQREVLHYDRHYFKHTETGEERWEYPSDAISS